MSRQGPRAAAAGGGAHSPGRWRGPGRGLHSAAAGLGKRGAHTPWLPARVLGGWRGPGAEGRAGLCTHGVIMGLTGPPELLVGCVALGGLVALPDTGLGRRSPKSASFSPFQLGRFPQFPTSYSSPWGEGIKVPVAACSSRRDMERNCSSQVGLWNDWGGWRRVCRPGFPVPGSCSPP